MLRTAAAALVLALASGCGRDEPPSPDAPAGPQPSPDDPGGALPVSCTPKAGAPSYAVALVAGTVGPPPRHVSLDGAASVCPCACDYDWDFGDGSPHESAATVSHVYPSAGAFAVTLTVKDRVTGAESRTTRAIDVLAPPEECAGIVPAAIPSAVEYREPVDTMDNYWPGTADGTGRLVALGSSYKYTHYRLVPSEGGERAGGFSGGFQEDSEGAATAPQPAGYHVIDRGYGQPGTFKAYDALGNRTVVGGTVGRPWHIRAMPGGGSVLLTSGGYALGSGTDRLEWMDEAGLPRAVAVLDGAVFAIAVSSTGDTLALGQELFFTDGAVRDVGRRRARWYDRDGLPVTEWFDLPPGTCPSCLRGATAPLADGSVALGLNNTWTHVLRARSTTFEEAPRWLALRPYTGIAIVRGGRANAFTDLTMRLKPCVATRVELVAASGTACGELTLPGDTCAGVSFGLDGTAITFAGLAPETASYSSRSAVWRWWPRLLE